MPGVDANRDETNLWFEILLDRDALLDMLLSLFHKTAVQLTFGVIDMHLADCLGDAAEQAKLLKFLMSLSFAHLRGVKAK